MCDGLVWGFLRDGWGLYDVERSETWYKSVGKCVDFGNGAGSKCASQSEGVAVGMWGG